METKAQLSLLSIDCLGVIFSASFWNIILRIRLLEYPTPWTLSFNAVAPLIRQVSGVHVSAQVILFKRTSAVDLWPLEEFDTLKATLWGADVAQTARRPLLYITVVLLEKTLGINHRRTQETPRRAPAGSRVPSQPFLTAFINTACSRIDCHVLRVVTSHRSGRTRPSQLSVLLLGGPGGPVSSDR